MSNGFPVKRYSIYTVTASVFDGCSLGGCCLFILEVICEDGGPAFWARREGEETKSKKQELKLGANVYRLTCLLALMLTMLQDGGMAHLWNNISTVVTDAKTAPSPSLGCSHQSATSGILTLFLKRCYASAGYNPGFPKLCLHWSSGLAWVKTVVPGRVNLCPWEFRAGKQTLWALRLPFPTDTERGHKLATKTNWKRLCANEKSFSPELQLFRSAILLNW